MTFHIFGALAEFERKLIVQRTRDGLAAARARGRLGGRPKKMDAALIRLLGLGHPENSDETQFSRELRSARIVIRNNLVYTQNLCETDEPFQWMLSNYDVQDRGKILLSSPVLDKVADAVFYARHPELDYRQSSPEETDLASEWSEIRGIASQLHPCD